MVLSTYLHDKKIIIENTLKDICTSFVSTPGVLRDAMEYMLFSNGKKIRPILAITTCEALMRWTHPVRGPSVHRVVGRRQRRRTP